MKKFKLFSVLFFAAAILASCSTTKKASSSMSYIQKLYNSLKSELPQAQVMMMGDTIKVIYPEVAMFDFGKDMLKADVRPSFVRFAGVIKNYPAVNFTINGYTDNVGGNEVNMNLSSRRAMTSKNILVENGVSGERIITNGMGEQKPVMSNATEDGRAANRRVEFLIYKAK